jgi:hypothetical protein
MARAPKPPRNFRDAGSGEYVTKGYADKHPGTTVSEPKPKPPSKPTPKKK